MFGKKLLATVVCTVLFSIAIVLGTNRTKSFVPVPPKVIEPESPPDPPLSGFEVTVLVDGTPLQQYAARGRTYIEASEHREYSLRVHNPLGIRVAVALSVDGLNTIDARRTSAFDASKWVIEPYSDIVISGWQMSSSRARKFYFTTERDSYGAKLGQTANLGVISAVFFKENVPIPRTITPQRGEPKEDDETLRSESSDSSAKDKRSTSGTDQAMPRKAAPSSSADLGENASTGIGRSVHNDVRWLNLNLNPNAVAETSIRYEYRAELVRLGVLPQPYYPDPVDRRERAKGFKDQSYCPEP